MLITGTGDTIQFVLSSSVATNQLQFTSYYNKYSLNSVTLDTNNGVSNNTTAVTLVPSPGSNQQNELRYCTIFNSDTNSDTIRIQINDGVNTRIVFEAILKPNEILQYKSESGWEVLSNTGNRVSFIWDVFNDSLNRPVAWTFNQSGGASSTLTSGVIYFVNLGKAEKSYSSIDVLYDHTVTATTVTWAEMAIYSGQKNNSESQSSFIRRGFTSISSTLTEPIGVKKTNISVTGITEGEQIFFTIGFQGTGSPAIRNYGYAITTDLTDFNSSSFGTSTNLRPSLNNQIYPLTAQQTPFALFWQGN